MNVQQSVQPKLSANGFGRRRGDREVGTRLENKLQSGKSNPSRSTNTGTMTGSKFGGYVSPSRDRIVYVTTLLIGHHVEVQVKDGSIYTGIFHATNSEKDFGVILKMARVKKDGSLQGQKATTESVSKAPIKTFIIPAKELVQVSAKGVSITSDESLHEVQHEKQQEILLDSSISQSRYVEVGRELEPWVPDEDAPQCPELENIFDGPWNRGWDQFETNEQLFGVRSTFDEELYTTKLERGPKMEELEKKASRLAREIEGEETQDLHSAEERGICFLEDFDVDEETRFSSVYRGKGVDDSGYEGHGDTLLDLHNNETFGGSDSFITGSTDLTIGGSGDGAQTSSSSSSKDQAQFSQSSIGLDLCRSSSYDHAKQLASEQPFKNFPVSDGENRFLFDVFQLYVVYLITGLKETKLFEIEYAGSSPLRIIERGRKETKDFFISFTAAKWVAQSLEGGVLVDAKKDFIKTFSYGSSAYITQRSSNDLGRHLAFVEYRGGGRRSIIVVPEDAGGQG